MYFGKKKIVDQESEMLSLFIIQSNTFKESYMVSVVIIESKLKDYENFVWILQKNWWVRIQQVFFLFNLWISRRSVGQILKKPFIRVYPFIRGQKGGQGNSNPKVGTTAEILLPLGQKLLIEFNKCCYLKYIVHIITSYIILLQEKV